MSRGRGCIRFTEADVMCEKCVELDKKIIHYQRLASSIMDSRAVDGITELIEKMKAKKAALHPERK